ncbi:MAG: hypothetical protein ACRDT4_10475 [Micromonosporaceae bacterium]
MKRRTKLILSALALAAVTAVAAPAALSHAAGGPGCRPDWSGKWHICLRSENGPGGTIWYHAHGWGPSDRIMYVTLYAYDGERYRPIESTNGGGWAATRRYRDGVRACLTHGPDPNKRWLCYSR